MSQLDRDARKFAAENGLEVVVPTRNELFIDIDNAGDIDVMDEMITALCSNGFATTVDKRTTSKSGNAHVYLKMDREITDLERICLQACLGSDRKRELLSLLRMWTCPEREPTVFFELPAKAEEVTC